MVERKAFTLIEVLISIALLGIILVPLFSVVNMLRTSNEHLLASLEKSKEVTKVTKVLFLDILGSDGRLKIQKDEFTRLCIEETQNSLYNLPTAKVCWLVLKDKNTLVRVEGNGYKLPIKSEERVEADRLIEKMESFDVSQEKDKVLVVMKQQKKEPIAFMVQGITNPVRKELPDGTKMMRDGRKILPDGTEIFKDGSKILPNGTIVSAPHKRKQPVKQPPGIRTNPGNPQEEGTGGKKTRTRLRRTNTLPTPKIPKEGV